MTGQQSERGEISIPMLAHPKTHAVVAELVRGAYTDPKGISVLDLGAGTGAMSQALLRMGFDVTPARLITRFVTDRFDDVEPFIVASILVSIVVNVIYLVRDWPVVRSAGELVSLAVAEVALFRALQVFPVDFADYSVDWAPYTRVVLIVAIVGTIIGAIVHAVKLARLAAVSV